MDIPSGSSASVLECSVGKSDGSSSDRSDEAQVHALDEGGGCWSPI